MAQVSPARKHSKQTGCPTQLDTFKNTISISPLTTQWARNPLAQCRSAGTRFMRMSAARALPKTWRHRSTAHVSRHGDLTENTREHAGIEFKARVRVQELFEAVFQALQEDCFPRRQALASPNLSRRRQTAHPRRHQNELSPMAVRAGARQRQHHKVHRGAFHSMGDLAKLRFQRINRGRQRAVVQAGRSSRTRSPDAFCGGSRAAGVDVIAPNQLGGYISDARAGQHQHRHSNIN